MADSLPTLRGMSPQVLKKFPFSRRQNPDFQQGWNRKGLISETGQHKMAFDVLAHYYQARMWQDAGCGPVVCVGEAMLELSRQGEAEALGYGGDTLNTAIHHLARARRDVGYFTALGSDPFADDCGASLGGGTARLLAGAGALCQTGLYAISTDAQGERSFAYWRDTSAARGYLRFTRLRRRRWNRSNGQTSFISR
jgi:hypothetical protein